MFLTIKNKADQLKLLLLEGEHWFEDVLCSDKSFFELQNAIPKVQMNDSTLITCAMGSRSLYFALVDLYNMRC